MLNDFGPTSIKSLYIKSFLYKPNPFFTNKSSDCLSWTKIISASHFFAFTTACPVPEAITLILISSIILYFGKIKL